MQASRTIMLLGLLGAVALAKADDVNVEKKTSHSTPPLLFLTPPSSFQLGREALRDKRYAEAKNHLEKAAADPATADEALLLLGNASLYSKDFPAAIAAYDRLINLGGNSAWNKKAVFQKADAYAAQKNWKAAADIYLPELEFLTSSKRQEMVAATYLKYADVYFAPGEKSDDITDDKARNELKTKLNRAKSLYLKAVEIGLTPTRHADVLLRAGLSDFYARDYSNAINGFARVIQQYPSSPAAARARYYNGVAQLRTGNRRGARRTLRDFLTDYADHEKRGDAAFAVLQTWGMPTPSHDREMSLGIAAARDFLANYPNHPRAVEVESWLGLAQFNRGHHEDAIREWEIFLARHRTDDSDAVAVAKYNLGESYLRQKKFDQAIATWEKFLAEHSVHRLWTQVQQQIINANYLIGEEAYKDKDYKAARAAWEAFSQKYPLDWRNGDIMFRLGMILYEAGQYEEALAQWRKAISKYGGTESASRSLYMIALTLEKQGKWDDALAALKLVTGKWQNEAQTRLTTLKTPRLAVFTERAFTTKENPTLKLVTRGLPRVELRAYRVDLRDYFARKNTITGVDQLDLDLIAPDKKWTQEIQGENPNYSVYSEVETTVKMPMTGAGVWAITCRSVSEESDETSENSALASNATLSANSVIFVTDVGIITKATKNDVLVWAQNLVTQQPVPGAQVLVSDGEKIVARGTTDTDGAYHYSREEASAGDVMKPGKQAGQDTAAATEAKPAAKTKAPKQKKNAKTKKENAKEKETVAPAEAPPAPLFPEKSLRVLAASEGHFAATETDLGRVAQVASLQPTGLVFTDRPLYRAGQLVQLAGIVRQVKDGVYAYAAGAEYDLTVTSPTNTVLLSRKLKLDEWGTVAHSLKLPADAVAGNYWVNLQRPAKTESGAPQQPFRAAGIFQVAAYQLDRVRLTIDIPKNVFLRGEEIKATATARYYSGEPLRARKLQISWSNQAAREYETDNEGKVSFSIPTRNFDEDETIQIVAAYSQEGAQAVRSAYVAAVGATVGLSTTRDVYLAGEQFPVKVFARDLAGKAFAGSWTLRALKLETSKEYGQGEREVATQQVSTNAEGEGSGQFSLKEGGTYILRAEGKDASGNPVISEYGIIISGNDDDVRLRLFAESDVVKAGANASIRVLWRGAKENEKNSSVGTERLALVTYEADRILGKQLVRLAPGESTISVPVQTRLAPLFRLSVALLDSDDLHQAIRWFAVDRNLKVEVTPEKMDGTPLKEASLRPGEKVRLKVTARDANGNPVAAQLAVGAIDAALWQRAAITGTAPPPVAALWGARYATDNPVWTAASNTFNFSAEARQKVLIVREAENFSRSKLADSAEYPDVPQDHWSYKAINQLSSAGMVQGFPNGSFSGGRAMTRYEMAVAVARALEKEKSDLQNSRASSSANHASTLRALKNEYAKELATLGVTPEESENRVPILSRLPLIGKLYRSTNTVNFDAPVASPYLATPSVNLPAFGNYFVGGSDTVRGYAGISDPNFNGIKTHFGIGSTDDDDDDDVSGSQMLTQTATGNALFLGGVEGIGRVVGQRSVRYDRFSVFDAGEPRKSFDETAYWNTQIQTNDKGEASVEFTLPDSLTQWRVSARGVTKDSRAGEGEASITANKDFWVELQAPPLFQAGDTGHLVAVLHNNSDREVQATVKLSSAFQKSEEKSAAGQATANNANVTIPANGSSETSFQIEVPDSAKAQISLIATAGTLTDGETKTIPIRAWGVDITSSKSGIAQDDRTVQIALPEGEYSAQRVRVTVAPASPRALLDTLEHPSVQTWKAPLASSIGLRLLALANATAFLKASETEPNRYARYLSEMESLANRLAVAQNNDGGWSWALSPRLMRKTTNRAANSSGQQERDTIASDIATTAEAYAALRQAQHLGIQDTTGQLKDTIEDANAFLSQKFGNALDEDKAFILWAQNQAGDADFAPVNRLYRSRNNLTPSALARLTLILKDAAREDMAREVLGLLLERTSEESLRAAINKTVEPAGANAIDTGDVAEVALVTWATARVQPSHSLLPVLSQLLWSRLEGSAWNTPRATSYAVAALLQSFNAGRRGSEKYTLAVSLDGQKIQTLEVDSDASLETFELPLARNQARLDFDMEGRGAYTYSVVMSGFTQKDLLTDAELEAAAGTSKVTPGIPALYVRRGYRPAPRMWNGKTVPAGTSVVKYQSYKEPVANEVRAGSRVQVSLSWSSAEFRKSDINDTVVVREPLPAGARFVEGSLSGNFNRFEIGDRSITMYFSGGTYGNASYALAGAQPGNYRVPPAKAWSWEKPGIYGLSTYKNFKVLPRTATVEEYPLTPDELFYLGKWSYEKAEAAIAKGEQPDSEDTAAAEKYLGELFNRDADPKDWKLTDQAGRDVSRILFSLALRKDDAAGTVKFFEALRERYPDLVIPFAEVVATAKAYGKIGETEREVQVLKATAEASFGREAGVAGTLVEEGEHRAAYDYLARQAQQYPDLANVQSSVYTLAQSIAARSSTLREEGEDGSDTAKKKQSEELNRLAAATLSDFLVLYPEHPLTDEASFAYAVNLTEQGKFQDAVDWAERSRKLYAKSDFLDDYDYIATYATFLAEKYDDALKLADQLAAAEYTRADGEKAPSSFRPFALYIAAQIHHARGESAKALELYKQVLEQFPDAREAADSFDEKSLKMPEVVTAQNSAPLQLKVTGRNVERAAVAVYKVDLLRFYQERRNLLGLAEMNLAGIAPAWEGSIDFGKARFTEIEKTLVLPLLENGAYFVTVQAEGGKPLVSGVAVRSSLRMQVQEDEVSGRVRVNLARIETGKDKKPVSTVAPKAEVWAVGSDDGDFRKGTTDLRGLVALDDLQGRVTVIAFQNGEYAFYRGERELQMRQVSQENNAAPAPAASKNSAKFKDQARDAYMTNQQDIMIRNEKSLNDAMQSGKGGAGGMQAGHF